MSTIAYSILLIFIITYLEDIEFIILINNLLQQTI